MNSSTRIVSRPPLGIPKGSVRALTAISIFGSLMAALILNRKIPETTFWYLWMVNYAVLGYYFANRQNQNTTEPNNKESINAAPSPLNLPRGSVRLILILTFLGTCGYFGYKWYNNNQTFWNDRAFFPMLSLAGFFLGRLLNALFQQKKQSPSKLIRILKDAKAIAVLLCATAVILTIPLSFQIPQQEQVLRSSFLFIFFYFGSRS